MLRNFPKIIVNFLKRDGHDRNLNRLIVKRVNIISRRAAEYVLAFHKSYIKNDLSAPAVIFVRHRKLMIGHRLYFHLKPVAVVIEFLTREPRANLNYID